MFLTPPPAKTFLKFLPPSQVGGACPDSDRCTHFKTKVSAIRLRNKETPNFFVLFYIYMQEEAPT